MPRNTREWAHRKLDMVNGNLETAQCHLLEVCDKYLELHPEIAVPVDQLVTAIDLFKDSVKIVRSHI